MKKLTNRQKQAIATKLKITETAIKLFKNEGFEATKIQDICNLADISVGAFYHHFNSKSDIVTTAFIQIDLILREKFENTNYPTHLNKLKALLVEGSDLVEELGWSFVGEAYKKLISMPEKYTYNDYQYVSYEIINCIELAIKAEELSSDIQPIELAKTIMRISRGAIFDWCLHKGDYTLKHQLLFDNELILNSYLLSSKTD